MAKPPLWVGVGPYNKRMPKPDRVAAAMFAAALLRTFAAKSFERPGCIRGIVWAW